MQKYLAKLKTFFHTLNFTRLLDFPTTRIIHGRRWRRTGSPEAEKEEKKELQKKDPTFDQVQRVNAMVVEFLQRDLGQKVLQYRELSALYFLILSFRLNGRSGPILNLTRDDVQTIQQTGALKTDQHVTRSYYDVTLKKENQHVWLKRMRGQFTKEFQTSPTLVFPTSKNTVDQSMSRTIRTVLGNFDLKDVDKDSHSTAVKNKLDTHFYRNKLSWTHVRCSSCTNRSHRIDCFERLRCSWGQNSNPPNLPGPIVNIREYQMKKVHLYFRPLRLKRPQHVPRLLLIERPYRETRLIGRKRPHCNPRLRRRERPRCETNQKIIALQVPRLVDPQVIQPLPLPRVSGGAGKLKIKEQCVMSCRMNSFLTMKKQAEETKLAPISPQVTMKPQMKKAWKLKLKVTAP